jgi:LysM repeat protein
LFFGRVDLGGAMARHLVIAVVLLFAAACGGDGDDPPPTTTSAPVTAPPETTPTTVAAPTHTVEPGDTLFLLARRFGTSVEAIAQANGISDPNAIEVGQVLQIPPAP